MIRFDTSQDLPLVPGVAGNADLDAVDPAPRRGYRYFKRKEDGSLEDWTTKRHLEYLLGLPDGRVITVTCWPWTYDFAVDYGASDGTILQSIPVIQASRLRDGGTTFITLDGNRRIVVNSPSRGGNATLGLTALERLSPDDYMIRESSDGVQVWWVQELTS